MKIVVSANQHGSRKTLHDRLRLEMKVAKHGIGMPAAEEANGVRVDIGIQESHGPTGTEGAGSDVGREETH
jgi:hypothetical protein